MSFKKKEQIIEHTPFFTARNSQLGQFQHVNFLLKSRHVPLMCVLTEKSASWRIAPLGRSKKKKKTRSCFKEAQVSQVSPCPDLRIPMPQLSKYVANMFFNTSIVWNGPKKVQVSHV